jgi:DUF971 family protein
VSNNSVPLEPLVTQQIGSELAISWNDGIESYIELERLRRSCPCAACGGEPDLLGRKQRSNVTYLQESFVLRTVVPIGGYALQFGWADGHSTGIYSFDYLRKLSQAPNAS